MANVQPVLNAVSVPFYKSVDTSVRLYNVGVACLVTAGLANDVWTLYKATNPAAFVATEFAKTCVRKFSDYLVDIGIHSYRASLSTSSSPWKKAIGVALDIYRIVDVIVDVNQTPYASYIPLPINKFDIVNHTINICGTLHNETSRSQPAVKKD